MRSMSLDVGTRTIGVAASDLMGMIANGVETIRRTSEERDLQRIGELIAEYEVDTMVVGYPKNMHNTVGESAQKTEELKAALERRTGLPVIHWDERLTTVAADRVLMESGVRREHRKESVDQIAAAMILQGYLDNLSFQGERDETGERE